jgi:hypothetical protein
MFKLDRKLSPDEFIQTFFEANKSDHQRPPHPWETLFRGGKCTKDQLQGGLLLRQKRPAEGIWSTSSKEAGSALTASQLKLRFRSSFREVATRSPFNSAQGERGGI